MNKRVAKAKIRKNLHKDRKVEVTPGLARYWFSIINKAMFDDSLPTPAFKVWKMRKYDGECFVWQDKVNGQWTNFAQIGINTDATSISRFLSVMAHETIHLWQSHIGRPMNHAVLYNRQRRAFKEKLGINVHCR